MALAAIALFEQRAALGLGVPEMPEQDLRIGVLEVEARIFLLGLQENVAIGDFRRPRGR